MSQAQIERLAGRVGMENPPLMAAIAMGESGGDTRNVGDGGDSLGLWQINTPAHPQFDANRLFEPTYNAKAAKAVLESQGLGAWTVYNTGAYKQFYKGKSTDADSLGGETKTDFESFIEGVDGLGETLSAPIALAQSVGELLFKPEGWLRIGKLLFGVVFMFMGINALLKQTLGVSPIGIVENAIGTATGVRGRVTAAATGN